ncbi:MAG: hypothetical protein KIS92_26585 [Planctomycetota bacterium]|nr:hypothetical protein [Planctomycetota bacterium]
MRKRAWLEAIGAGTFLFVAGCGGGKPPATPNAPAPSAVPRAPAPGPAQPAPAPGPAPSPAPAADAAAPKEFSVDAEASLRARLTAVVAESPLWKTYFAHRLAQPGAKTPLVAFKAAMARKTEKLPGQAQGGGFLPGSVTLTLNVADAAGGAPLYAKDATQALPSVVWTKGQSPQEKAFLEAESVAIHELAGDAALILMAGHPDAKTDFLPTLLSTLNDEKAPVRLRAHAAAALGQVPEPPAEVFEKLAQYACVPTAVKMDTNRVVSNAAQAALTKAGAPAVAALERMLASPERGAPALAAKQLKEFGAPAAPALASAVAHQDWSTYVEVTRALAALGKDAAPAVPALIEQAKLRDPMRRDAAVEVLAKIGAPAAEPLKEALAAAKTDETAAPGLIAALERLGPDARPALPVLEELAKSPNRSLSNRAKAAIKKIGAQ